MLFIGDPNRALTILLTAAMLSCITLNLDYCCCIFYIFYAGFDFIAGIDPIGLAVQKGRLLESLFNPIVFLSFVSIIFEPIAIYFVWNAYKEFKFAR